MSPEILSGWKDIANYMGKGVRRVQCPLDETFESNVTLARTQLAQIGGIDWNGGRHPMFSCAAVRYFAALVSI